MSPRDIWIIARFELVRHLRSRHAIVAGVILVGFCAYGSYRLAELADRLNEATRELGPALGVVAGMVENLTGLPVVSIQHLLAEHPPVLVALFALIMALMPMLCLILAYDQTATDIETRHVRYLLFRSDRASIYLGKALGAQLLIAAAIALVLAVVAGFLALRSNALEGMAGLLYVLRIWITAVLYALPFVAFLGLVSALVGRARRSFALAVLYWIAVTTLAGLLSLADERLLKLRYLFPTVDRFELMRDSIAGMWGVLVHLLIFTLAATALGLWRFQSRDL